MNRPEIPPDAQIAPDPEWPRPLRARARRCRAQLERLDQVLRADYPEGAAIAHDPWLRIPAHSITHSGRTRSPVPARPDHSFRPHPITTGRQEVASSFGRAEGGVGETKKG